MSKYIRTKFDDILKVEEETDSYYYTDDLFDYEVEKDAVVKVSDKLEDLFDFAVIIPKEKPNQPLFTKIWDFKDLFLSFTNATIHGAIWLPDKGLKLIAEIVKIESGSIEWKFR